MGCEEMLNTLEKAINNEISEFTYRRSNTLEANKSRVSTFGLQFVTNETARKAFEKFINTIHNEQIRDKLILDCESAQKDKERISNI